MLGGGARSGRLTHGKEGTLIICSLERGDKRSNTDLERFHWVWVIDAHIDAHIDNVTTLPSW